VRTPSTAATTASAAVSDDSVERNEDGEELEFVKMERVSSWDVSKRRKYPVVPE